MKGEVYGWFCNDTCFIDLLQTQYVLWMKEL